MTLLKNLRALFSTDLNKYHANAALIENLKSEMQRQLENINAEKQRFETLNKEFQSLKTDAENFKTKQKQDMESAIRSLEAHREGYVGEIRLFAQNFAPLGWEICNGRLLSIANNQALFSLIGTFYGGDGRTNFALPDLRGRVVLGHGHRPDCSNDYLIGNSGGSEEIMSDISVSNANSESEETSFFSVIENTTTEFYTKLKGVFSSEEASEEDSLSQRLKLTGDAMQPYIVMNYCICVDGLYPSRS